MGSEEYKIGGVKMVMEKIGASEDLSQPSIRLNSEGAGWRIANGAIKATLPLTLFTLKTMLGKKMIKSINDLKSDDLKHLYNVFNKSVDEWIELYQFPCNYNNFTDLKEFDDNFRKSKSYETLMSLMDIIFSYINRNEDYLETVTSVITSLKSKDKDIDLKLKKRELTSIESIVAKTIKTAKVCLGNYQIKDKVQLSAIEFRNVLEAWDLTGKFVEGMEKEDELFKLIRDLRIIVFTMIALDPAYISLFDLIWSKLMDDYRIERQKFPEMSVKIKSMAGNEYEFDIVKKCYNIELSPFIHRAFVSFIGKPKFKFTGQHLATELMDNYKGKAQLNDKMVYDVMFDTTPENPFFRISAEKFYPATIKPSNIDGNLCWNIYFLPVPYDHNKYPMHLFETDPNNPNKHKEIGRVNIPSEEFRGVDYRQK